MHYFEFIRRNLKWLIGGFLLTFFSSFGQTFYISLSAGGIREAYGLSHGDFGGLYMIATLGSALTLPYFGRIVDFLSVSKVTLIIIPALATACVAMWFSHSIILLVVLLFALRLFGQGMMTHTSMTAMGRWFAAHRGQAVSVATLGHQAGEGVLPILFVSVVAFAGWRASWLYAAAVLILFALPAIYLLMAEERKPQSDDHNQVDGESWSWTRAEVVRDPLFWLMMAGVLAPSFIGTTIFFHQIYLVELNGWAPERFALSFSLMAVFTVIFALISGVLIDRFTAVRVLPFFLLPLAAACLVLAFGTADFTMFAFMALLGVSYGISSTLFGAVWPEVYGTRYLGSVRSLVIAMMVFGTAMGPGVTGYLIDQSVPYPLQIMVMGLYCLAASAIMLFVSRRVIERKERLSQH